MLYEHLNFLLAGSKRNLALRRPAYQSPSSTAAASRAVDGKTHSAFSYVEHHRSTFPISISKRLISKMEMYYPPNIQIFKVYKFDFKLM